jgi:hypothetical protein
LQSPDELNRYWNLNLQPPWKPLSKDNNSATISLHWEKARLRMSVLAIMWTENGKQSP